MFQPRVFTEIMGDMVARLVSSTPLTDVNYGSVWTTMLEAAATEDDEQYFQMLELVRAYSIDTTSGADLDARAQESVGSRLSAQKATSFVSILDSAVVKVETGTYAGLTGAVKDQLYVNGDSATGFSTVGSLIIGRGTPNAETVPYSSIDVFANYVRFNLDAGLQYDHGTDETIILAQGGNRTVNSGSVIFVPESDISAKVEYTTTADAIILDGESQVDNISIEAVAPGTQANVPIGLIQKFDSLPFPTAQVTNPYKITNGRDIETNQALRDRIKDHIQSLSRGTTKSIITGISGLVSLSDNKRVVSSSLIEPTTPADVVKLFIDDGAKSIFQYNHIGVETIISSATGGEKFLKLINTPLVKAFVETPIEGPYGLVGGEDLFVDVGGAVETIIFESTDFLISGEASAQEIVEKINSLAKSFEARLSGANGENIKLFARSNTNEEIRVTGGSANAFLLFPTDWKFTSKLYLNRGGDVRLLSKDGVTASLEAGNTQGYNLNGNFKHLCVIADGRDRVQHIKFRPTLDFVDPNSATTNEILDIANGQLQGVLCQSSSNGNKFRLVSKTERSNLSKIRVVENFNTILSEEGATLIDRTSDLQNNATPTPVFGEVLDYMYLFHSEVKFGSVYVALQTLASANIDFSVEYYNGTAWVETGVTDTTIGFTQSGHIFFEPPYDWEQVTINGVTGYAVRLQRNQALAITQPQVEAMRICGANESFGFSELEVTGANQDYTINRFIGQVELNEPLEPNDKLEIGSYDTRPINTTLASANYGGLVGQTLSINIDGVVQNYTFQNSDFFDPLSALSGEVRIAIANNFTGITVTDNGLKVTITLNRFNDGFIQVQNSGANSILQFPTTLKSSLLPHISAIESVNGPFVFNPDDKLIVVMDQNQANTYNTPIYFTSTSTGSTTSTIVDTTLSATFPLAGDLVGYEIEVTTGTQAGQRRNILSYVPATGTITVDAVYGVTPGIETYYILPNTATRLAKFLNNTKITLLSKDANILVVDGGRLQISSKVAGEEGAVNVSGGDANLQLQFSTIQKFGIDGYRYYTGLPQEVQWTVDGKDDQTVYQGIRAAGIQVEVAEPVRKPIAIQLDVTPQEGTTLSSITNSVKSAVKNVIDSLGVGADVILSDITVAVKQVNGVFDVTVLSPLDNIAIADNELARINEKDIAVG